MQFADNDHEELDSDIESLLEREFPLGDGTADVEATVACPYCGEVVVIAIDPGSGERQEYVEDCQVCCRPWRVAVAYRANGAADVAVTPLDS